MLIAPLMAELKTWSGWAFHEGRLLRAEWHLDGVTLSLTANLSDEAAAAPLPRGHPLWGGLQPEQLPPWSVYWTREG